VLPTRLKAELLREFDRLDLVTRQLADIERERDAALEAATGASEKAALLVRLKGIEPQGATDHLLDV
jgi:transposase